MTQPANRKPRGKLLRVALSFAVIFGIAAIMMFVGYLLGTEASTREEAGKAAATFFDTASPPIWIILFLNVASFLSAIVAAYAAIRVTPQTSLAVADIQAEVARESISVAAASADAASQSARAANRSSDNQGVHAVARLRQEWINELRSRIAEAHALLSNWRRAGDGTTEEQKRILDERVVQANEAMARIELLLNPKENPSKALLTALRALEEAAGDFEKRRALGPPVIAAAQKVLKKEWDRLRDELRGKALTESKGKPTDLVT